MEVLFPAIMVISFMVMIYNHLSVSGKTDAYIKQRGGTFVSKEQEYSYKFYLFNRKSSFYKLVYYDKDKTLRTVLLRVSSLGFTEFIDDHEVHGNGRRFNISNDSTAVVKKDSGEQTKKTLVDYTYKCAKGTLIIQQEFYHPNKGENVLLNGMKAPDGKYKLGFMNYIAVENGMVKELTMF